MTPRTEEALTEISGFFDRKGTEYRVVVLDTNRVERKDRRNVKWCREFAASTAAALVATVMEEGYDIGRPEKVAQLCDAAPRYRGPSRRWKPKPPHGTHRFDADEMCEACLIWSESPGAFRPCAAALEGR